MSNQSPKKSELIEEEQIEQRRRQAAARYYYKNREMILEKARCVRVEQKPKKTPNSKHNPHPPRERNPHPQSVVSRTRSLSC